MLAWTKKENNNNITMENEIDLFHEPIVDSFANSWVNRQHRVSHGSFSFNKNKFKGTVKSALNLKEKDIIDNKELYDVLVLAGSIFIQNEIERKMKKSLSKLDSIIVRKTRW